MALKLFRATGYSTLMLPGESRRRGPHPGWLVLAVSLWIGVACNVGVWRMAAGAPADVRTVLAASALLAGGSGMLLSALAWRRTLRLAATALLLLAALLACGLWVQQLPVEALWQQRPRTLVPAWPSFLRARVLVLMLVLALVPIVCVWNLTVRCLPGPAQLRVNVLGSLLALLVFGAGLLLLA